MAKATTTIRRKTYSEEELKEKELQEIQQLLVNHKDAIHETFEIIQHMQDRRILPMLTALFSEGDKVLNVLVKTVDNPETARALKNMLLMGGVLGTLNVDQLEPIVLKINQGIARMAEFEKIENQSSYVSLVKAVKDPEFRVALNLTVAFLKGLGEDQDAKERTTQQPEDRAHYTADQKVTTAYNAEKEASQRPMQQRSDNHAGWKWLAAAGGISLLTVALTMGSKK
ncbi:DUF1641 domain-containing protein [Alkalicoccobacillus porphyridii]|uniref:DUF1641 domain-containing protein n=1 Tax=Alkalicoccobacillus porphyridii TaxID=2597270 RepID=A0A553ZVI6_9BACI|nr:DUF1641 domain-containing protein [Alkalicoccobacillus porphyridii]TSB45355.1 DUF1641 domain-containing protein [Alkalicoccobacillus porphyridii]